MKIATATTYLVLGDLLIGDAEHDRREVPKEKSRLRPLQAHRSRRGLATGAEDFGGVLDELWKVGRLHSLDVLKRAAEQDAHPLLEGQDTALDGFSVQLGFGCSVGKVRGGVLEPLPVAAIRHQAWVVPLAAVLVHHAQAEVELALLKHEANRELIALPQSVLLLNLILGKSMLHHCNVGNVHERIHHGEPFLHRSRHGGSAQMRGIGRQSVLEDV